MFQKSFFNLEILAFSHACLIYNAKVRLSFENHPVILSNKNMITSLIIRESWTFRLRIGSFAIDADVLGHQRKSCSSSQVERVSVLSEKTCKAM